ncbi:MAG: Hpt domain-containing protein [Nitrospinae bacterium]|nr:Hpt domain-containing protein [Nitrospinota bacterium]
MGNGERIIVKVDADLKELTPGFLQARHEDVAGIAAALETGDWGVVYVLGHSMKGSGGGYGFDEITAIGAVIETAAKAKDAAAVKAGAARLADYLGRIDIQYA